MGDTCCPICLNTNLKLQKHHVLPKEYGGSHKGPLLELCATCHLNIHYTAEAEYIGKQPSYLLTEQRARASMYVEAIKRAKAVYDASSDSRNLKKKIIIELPEIDLIKLHKLKADKGYKSLDAYLQQLIKKELHLL